MNAIAIRTFLEELIWALKQLPATAAEQWRAAHTRTEWLYVWEDGVCGHRGKQPIFWHEDEQSVNSYHDYKLWRTLGRATDALLALIVLSLVVMVILAVL